MKNWIIFLLLGMSAASVSATLTISGNNIGRVEIGKPATVVITFRHSDTVDRKISEIEPVNQDVIGSLFDIPSGEITVPVGENVQVPITFTPTGAYFIDRLGGSFSSVSSDRSFSQRILVTDSNISGTHVTGNVLDMKGFLGQLQIEGDLDFGLVDANTTRSHTLSVQNIGPYTLNMAPSVSGSEWALNWISGPLAPGETRELVVDFSPQTPGSTPVQWAKSSLLLMNGSNLHSSEQTLNVSGNVAVRSINWDDTLDQNNVLHLRFAEAVPVDAVGVQTLYISNEGNDDLTIHGVDLLSGEEYGIFNVVLPEESIPPGEGDYITFYWEPLGVLPGDAYTKVSQGSKIESDANHGKIGRSVAFEFRATGSLLLPEMLRKDTMYLGDGRYRSEMLGDFHLDPEDPSRVYSKDFGWLYITEGGEVEGGLWFWSHQMKSWLFGFDLSIPSLKQLLREWVYRKSDKESESGFIRREAAIGIRG